MKTFNFSKDSEYHSQRNNKIVPHGACNTTSLVMALKQANIEFKTPEGWQEEDWFTKIMRSDRAYEKMREVANWAFNSDGSPNYPPQQVHDMLVWGVEVLVGRRNVDRFRINWDLREIVFALLNGAGVALSGDFLLQNGGTLRHVVSLAGFSTSQENMEEVTHYHQVDLNKIETYIIDDPYGNYLLDYNDHHGNNVEFTRDLFMGTFRVKNQNTKWAHIVGYNRGV